MTVDSRLDDLERKVRALERDNNALKADAAVQAARIAYLEQARRGLGK